MDENINIFDFELRRQDMDAIATLDTVTSLFFNNRGQNLVKALGQAERNTLTDRKALVSGLMDREN